MDDTNYKLATPYDNEPQWAVCWNCNETLAFAEEKCPYCDADQTEEN